MAKRSDKKYLDKWAVFRENMSRSTPIDLKETEAAKRKRIQELEADCEKWFAYYFPVYYKNKPAPFHIKGLSAREYILVGYISDYILCMNASVRIALNLMLKTTKNQRYLKRF